ncbi:hypothetical protein PAGR_g1951 [Pantoea ananatis PA13]|nr:hypothetical protein PAGR_g1951 [Pantoea ananatis PA13]
MPSGENVKTGKFFDLVVRTDTLAICLLFRSSGQQPTLMDRHRRCLTLSLRSSARQFTPDRVFSAFPGFSLSRPSTRACVSVITSFFWSH